MLVAGPLRRLLQLPWHPGETFDGWNESKLEALASADVLSALELSFLQSSVTFVGMAFVSARSRARAFHEPKQNDRAGLPDWQADANGPKKWCQDAIHAGFPMSRSEKSRELTQIVVLIFSLAAIAVLYLAKTVVVPLALAILFSFLLSPLVNLLERIRLPRVLAIIVVILAAGIAVGTIGWTVFNQLVSVTDHMADFTYNINRKLETLKPTKSTSFSRAEEELDRLGQQLSTLNLNAAADHSPQLKKQLGASADHPISVQEVGKSDRLDTIHGVLGSIVSVFLVVVFTFFMLLQREDLRNRLIRLTGRGHLNLMTQAMDEAGHRVSRYLALQLLVNTCYGSIIFAALYFLGLPHALLWGALAGILRFIPYVGAPTAALLPTIFSVAVYNLWTPTLLIMAVFFCMEILTANIIEPHLYGKQTGLSPLAILVAAVFWTLIWGPIGLILSVPLTVCLVVVGSHVPSLKFLAVLLGDQPVMRPEAHYYQRLLASDAQEASHVLDSYVKDKSVSAAYDQLMIPALGLFEQDRHRNALDQETVDFITETAEEQVEELGLRSDEPQPSNAHIETIPNLSPPPSADKQLQPEAVVRRHVVCVAVRDDSDEIVATMLSQMLRRAGHAAKTIPPGNEDHVLAEIFAGRPDVVCLSALPPYAMSYARTLYEAVQSRQSDLEIVIGLWNHSGDLAKAAKVITGEQRIPICTTLAEAVQRVSLREQPERSPQETDAGVAEARV
jgi:predicted PurR-regulated permease PerM